MIVPRLVTKCQNPRNDRCRAEIQTVRLKQHDVEGFWVSGARALISQGCARILEIECTNLGSRKLLYRGVAFHGFWKLAGRAGLNWALGERSIGEYRCGKLRARDRAGCC